MITCILVLTVIIGGCLLAAVLPIVAVLMILPLIDIVVYFTFKKLKEIYNKRKEEKGG